MERRQIQIGAGLVLAVSGFAKRTKLGYALAMAGVGIAIHTLLAGEGPESGPAERTVKRAITIAKPKSEVYAFWAKPENLVHLFPGVESITPLDDSRWRWRAQLKGTAGVTWDTESAGNDEPVMMSWKSVGESPIAHEGSVVFAEAPGGSGAEVRFTSSFQAAGTASAAALLLGGRASGRYIDEALRRSKQLLETGELLST